jgi:hypothetical protein
MVNALEWTLELPTVFQRKVVRSIARKLLEDDDEFSRAVETLDAEDPIYSVVKDQTPEIWWRSGKNRQEILSVGIIYCVGIAGLIVGLVYSIARIIDWVLVNWPDNGSVVSNLVALFSSAYADWYSIGAPERWIYLFGAAAVLVIARRIIRGAFRDLPTIWRQWILDFEDELRPIIRVELNSLTNAENPRTLTSLIAPGLGETSVPYRLIARKELDRIRHLNEKLGASAIAISGYRGVGKTTLLKSIVEPTDRENRGIPGHIFVSAPVTYDPSDFIIHLYSQLCKLVIGATGPERSRAALMLRRVVRPILTLVRLAIRVALLLLLAWAWLWVGLRLSLPSAGYVATLLEANNLPIVHSISASIFITALVIVGWSLSGKLRIPRSSLQAPPEITSLAEKGLERLQFLQTISIEGSVGVKRGFLDLGGKRARQLAENPITLPELVASYREFAEQVAKWLYSGAVNSSDLLTKIALKMGYNQQSRLMICIDEVDRISTAEAAEKFINDIKAIFGIPYCVYLVTVSEEALAGFERRVVRLRPALDSAFDEVLRLDIFTLSQSLELLRQHVAGFPDIFISLCHCLAGGIPRDLVREARALLDKTREASPETGVRKREKANANTPNLKPLAAATVTRSVMTLKRGLVTRTAIAEKEAEQWQNPLPLLISEAWPGDPGDEMFEHLTTLYASGQDDHASLELCAAVFFYATVYDVFTQKTEDMANDVQDAKSKGTTMADRLAGVRGLLALNATIAIEALNSVRRTLGLRELLRRPSNSSTAKGEDHQQLPAT